ncbi:hypothetical protein L486_03054 [Kwoniella mangroviensis CBS 10435]|uniref:Palmitoyltransferase n=1 Tax=Kwoniella mangroviensis CBS 10435 TaxID=1331196 RepID=A0A1B9ISR4_9TREE|nr:hypothetical protein L486_03054 [Kwoniella mangroviensis CBS 10435]
MAVDSRPHTQLDAEAHSQAYNNNPRPSPSSSFRWRSPPSQPDNWVKRKWAIFVVLTLACWSFYVVAGRVCTPMIRRYSSTGLGRSTGIGTLVGFIIFWLFMTITYLRMLFTSPGLAPKHVAKSPEPDLSEYRLEDFTPTAASNRPFADLSDAPEPSELAPIGNLVRDTLHGQRISSESGTEVPLKTQKSVRDWRTVERPVPAVLPNLRWCRHCEIIKPPRTRHCRHCGVCILQYDHHCLWIGQCVGWGNHKFFIIFTFWGAIFCAYLMGLLIAVSAKSPGMDGQVLALIILSALFGLFTFSMCAAHINLIVTGRTTVESYSRRDQHDAESRILQQEYGYFFHNSERRKVQKKWREEWGNTPVDARWVFGTKRELWEQEMGKSPLGWILPIGRPLGDGLHYGSNPRFGPNGEWLKKKDWPKELQT